MAKRPPLGSRPVLRAEPEQPPVIEEDEGDPVAEAKLDAALASLRSEDPRDILASLDQIKSLVGDEAWSGLTGKHEQLRASVETAGRSKADIAREGLRSHLDWVDANLTDPVDIARATSHALSLHYEQLDPVDDADTIAAANRMFAKANPPTNEET
jgi:hypothetical protein